MKIVNNETAEVDKIRLATILKTILKGYILLIYVIKNLYLSTFN
jgi:hypothetical protein